MAKILVVDDAPTIRELLQQVIVDAGHVAVLAENGIQALRLAKQSKPDLVFLDILMPKMDGFQVVRRFQRDQEVKKIPVVMVSAKTSDADRFYTRVIGAVHHIGKPFTPEEILGAIERFAISPANPNPLAAFRAEAEKNKRPEATPAATRNPNPPPLRPPIAASATPPAQVDRRSELAKHASVAMSPLEFSLFRRLIKDMTGVHLSEEKTHLVRSRLIRRLLALRLPSFRSYYDHITEGSGAHNGEREFFLDAVTTHKTEFFRERAHFDLLDKLFREEWAGRAPIRILSAGCSSGEEPYTMAMVAFSALGPQAEERVEIYAGDLSKRVLETALSGIYSRDQVQEIPLDIVQRTFLRGTGRNRQLLQIAPHVSRMVHFRRLQLMEALPYEFEFDAIFCRNVSIYFDRPAKLALYRQLFGALTPRGYLFMGHSESLTLFGGLPPFEQIQASVYRLRR